MKSGKREGEREEEEEEDERECEVQEGSNEEIKAHYATTMNDVQQHLHKTIIGPAARRYFSG